MMQLRYLRHMKIRDEMTKGVATVGIDDPLTDAIDAMARNDISGIVVVYPNGTAAGVVSSFDIVRVLSEKSREEIKKMTADDVMTDIISIEPEKTIGDALKLMVEKRIHRVVVLSSTQAGGKPIGVLSATDIVKKVRGEKPTLMTNA
ncbi:CBS domain-containing protein [archaeon]|nr:CBS domain-containing protein [archaeon]